jgi:hypothetical protein
MRGLAQRGKAVHRHAQGGETVAQIDRAAAGMHVRDNDFAQAAVAGGGGHKGAILGDVGHGHKLVERSSLGDEGNHFIDEAVEARDHAVASGWRAIEKRFGLADRAHDSLSS